MTEVTLKLSGLDCAACALRAERALKGFPGLSSASVSYADRCCLLGFAGEPDLPGVEKRLKRFGFGVPTEEALLRCPGLTAANAGAVQTALLALLGVREVRCDGVSETIAVRLWPVGLESRRLPAALGPLGLTATVEALRGGDEDRELGERMGLLRALCFATLLTLPLVWDLHPHIQMVLATAVQFGPGLYFYRGAWRGRGFTMDALVALSTSIIYLYSVYTALTVRIDIQLYFLSECVLLSLILFGKYLETLSRSEASGAIRRLLRLQPPTALVERGDREKLLDVEDIQEHDVILLRSGQRVPVDGVILEGRCAVDEAMLTGESLPVEKGPGDRVYAGTLCREGGAREAATELGKDSVLQQIVAVVRRAQSSKAPIQRLADRIAGVFIPGVTVAAAGVFALWYFLWAPGDLGRAVYCLCSVLVIACPCALGLATPTGIMVGSGRAAELGVLFRDGGCLETARRVTAVVFDKTGTLTYGTPEVTDVLPLAGDRETLLYLAAGVERLSRHPVGEALVHAAAGSNALPPTVEGFRELPGRGVEGTVLGRRVLCGSRRLLDEHGVDLSPLDALPDLRQQAKTEVCVAADGALLGVMGVSDRLRPDGAQAVKELRDMGLAVWLLTGDNPRTAAAIAAQAGIENVLSQVPPEEKAAAVRRLQAQGARVAMVGDGINDAPALATADLGIAMGSGTDVAIESAGVTLLGGVRGVPLALRLSKATVGVIRQNLLWALFYNALCIPAAAAGIVNPSMAAAAMSLSSNGVLLNSLRLKKAEAMKK